MKSYTNLCRAEVIEGRIQPNGFHMEAYPEDAGKVTYGIETVHPEALRRGER